MMLPSFFLSSLRLFFYYIFEDGVIDGKTIDGVKLFNQF